MQTLNPNYNLIHINKLPHVNPNLDYNIPTQKNNQELFLNLATPKLV